MDHFTKLEKSNVHIIDFEKPTGNKKGIPGSRTRIRNKLHKQFKYDINSFEMDWSVAQQIARKLKKVFCFLGREF